MSRCGFRGLIAMLALTQAVGCGSGSNPASTTPPGTPPGSISDPVAITTTSILPATIGMSFSQQLEAVNGKAPYSWTLVAGQLPAGISLAGSAGALAGTPTQSGQFTYTIKVSDSSSPTQTSTAPYNQMVSGVQLDSYGGLVSMPSSNPATPAYWRLEKFGHKWMFVDPANNGFYMMAVDEVTPPTTGSCSPGQGQYIIAQKYGDVCGVWTVFSPQQNRRLKAYGFNTLGTYSNYSVTMPFDSQAAWPGDHYQPVKLPYWINLRPGFYSTYNGEGYSGLTGTTLNFRAAISSFYNGYMAVQLPDWDSPYIYKYLDLELSENQEIVLWQSKPYSQYLIGISGDDSDEWFGLTNGADFPTTPAGQGGASEAWLVMSSSPQLVSDVQTSQLYTDTTNYMKKAWHDQLVAKYGTIAALNAAWGANYTTFDSTGTQVNGEAMATGDGSTLSFAKTLAHPPTYNSIQVLVGGTVVAGDIGQYANNTTRGDGNLWFYGPHIDNTGCFIDWSTGAITIKFAAGYAPASGVPITVNYIYGGWGTGTGLMDEDARVSHQSWTGIDWTPALSSTNPTLVSDLSSLTYNIAYYYFSNFRTHLHAKYPNLLFFGPSSLGTWSGMPPKEVLQAANGTLDAIELQASSLTGESQAELNYIYTYYGDHPIFSVEFRFANPDSGYYSANPPSLEYSFATQLERGQNYSTITDQYISYAYPNGSLPWVGLSWWTWWDNEGVNWGLDSVMDNLYNGTEAQIAKGTDAWGFPDGGEAHNYGDALDSINQANQYVMANLPSKQ